MQTTSRSLLTVAGLLLVWNLWLTFETTAQPAPAAKPVAQNRIAVIDVSQILKSSKYKNAEQLLRSKYVKIEEQFMKEAESIAEFRNRLNAFSPGSPEFIKLKLEIESKENMFLARATAERVNYQNELIALSIKFQKKIRDYSKAICEANQFECVIHHREQLLNYGLNTAVFSVSFNEEKFDANEAFKKIREFNLELAQSETLAFDNKYDITGMVNQLIQNDNSK